MEVCLHQLLHVLVFAVRTWKGHGRKLPQIVPGEVHIRYQGKFIHGKGGHWNGLPRETVELPFWRYSQKVWMWWLRTCFNGKYDGAVLTVGLYDFTGLFQA